MPHILIDTADIQAILKDGAGISQDLRQKLAASLEEPDERHEGIITLARDLYQKEREIEIDEGALLSEGDDNGTYVMAWLWLSFEGTPYDKNAEPAEV